MRRFPGAALVTLGALLVAGEARADTLELVTYTPPAGWSAQEDGGARAFVRKDAGGVGIAMVFAGRPAGGAPADAFAEEWRARVAPLFPGPAPKPVVQAMGDVTVALAMSQGTYEGQPVAITFVTLVGRGRAQSVVGIASGNEPQAQVSTFIGGLGITPATGSTAAPPASGGDVELEVAAPPGYSVRRDPRGLVIAPARVDRATPCTYGVTPPRASQGNLEADAHAAFAEVFAGWEKRGSEGHYHLKKGVAAAGWPFYWYRGELQRPAGGAMTYAHAMVMVVPAGPRRVSTLWGIGDLATCTMEDRTFALIFHSLRPRGWTSDGGKAFAQQLPGSWILSTGRGSAIYQLDAGGRYVYALNATTSVTQISDATALKTTAQLYHEGRYTLRGNELELVRDDKPQTQRLRIRIVDEFEAGTWTRGLYLLGDSDEIQYLRQNWRP